MTALTSHKKLFISVSFLLLVIAACAYLLLQKTKVFQSTSIAVATLQIVPSQQSVIVGDEVELAIRLNTKEQAVNTVTTNLSYPAEILELTNLSLQDSFAKIWFEKETGVPGQVHLTGSLPTPGFSGQASFAKLTFRAKEKGEAKIEFSSNTAVFRNLDSVNILGQTESSLVNVR